MNLAKTLMIQGTASNVGKSVVTAGICRVLKRRGYKVAPFKAQNMANNSFVTADGGEMGRAQVVQAAACGIEPSVLMNPILLKPDTDMKAQVVAMGKPTTKIKSIGHPDYQKQFFPVVESALEELRSHYDVVVMEGAGSPAEMNLKARDLVNMNLALRVKAPVVLVGDIDWGGIFAQLVGTHDLLEPAERNLIKAFLINKFRGDLEILKPGLDWIEGRTKKKVLGVLPYISDMDLAEEDSIASAGAYRDLRGNVALDAVSGKARDRRDIRARNDQLLIDVIWLPRISNFTDFDELEKEDDVILRYLHEPDRHSKADLIIIPGTKSTISDLHYMKKAGLADYVKKSSAAGVPVLGICGGYQLLGREIIDEAQVESKMGSVKGLCLLPAKTYYEEAKITRQVEARHLESGTPFCGYEIHMGRTVYGGKTNPYLEVSAKGKNEWKEDGIFQKTKGGGESSWIAGTYVHGLFDSALFRTQFLNDLRARAGLREQNQRAEGVDIFDRLAERFEEHLDIGFLEGILNE